jgi:hypothetical protein
MNKKLMFRAFFTFTFISFYSSLASAENITKHDFSLDFSSSNNNEKLNPSEENLFATPESIESEEIRFSNPTQLFLFNSYNDLNLEASTELLPIKSNNISSKATNQRTEQSSKHPNQLITILNLSLDADSLISSADVSFDLKQSHPLSENRVENNSRIAQAPLGNSKSQPIAFSQRDFETPDSPASLLIGSSAKKVPNISTPGAIATTLLNGANTDGKFATGIGIDTIPYLLLRSSGMTLGEYQNDWNRFLSNTSLSIATNAVGTGEASRLGLGVQFVLMNNGDKRTNNQYLGVLENFSIAITQDPKIGGLPKEERDKQIQERINNFKKSDEYISEIKKLEREAIWTLAAGTSFIAPTGRFSDLTGDGAGLWTTYRSGISENTQMILHASYRSGERLKDLNGTDFNGDTITVGTRFRIGDPTKSLYSLETAYNIESKQGASSNSYISLGVGLDHKLFDQENVWLSLFFRSDPGRQNGSDFRFNSGLKWQFGPSGNL